MAEPKHKIPENDSDEPTTDEREMTFLDHLEELRWRFVKTVIGLKLYYISKEQVNMYLRLNIFFLFVTFSSVIAQYEYFPLSGGAIDIPTDARSVAMGESFAGMKDPLAGLLYNPASLSGVNGVSFFHTRREFFASTSWNYFTTAIAVKSSIGNFGLLYSLFDRNWSFENLNYYDYILGLTYSKFINEELSIGISLKTYDRIREGSPTYETALKPILVDLGILYSPQLIEETNSTKYDFNVGVSVQNFGTDLSQKINWNGSFEGEEYLISTESFFETPKYLRIGFSSSFLYKSKQEEMLNPFLVTLCAEYRNLLNAYPSRRSERDKWGIGTELTFFELFTLRGGGFSSPFDGVWGDKGEFAFRYGFGACVPFQRVGWDFPFTLNLDYGEIPLNENDKYSPVQLLSLALHYNNEIF